MPLEVTKIRLTKLYFLGADGLQVHRSVLMHKPSLRGQLLGHIFVWFLTWQHRSLNVGVEDKPQLRVLLDLFGENTRIKGSLVESVRNTLGNLLLAFKNSLDKLDEVQSLVLRDFLYYQLEIVKLARITIHLGRNFVASNHDVFSGDAESRRHVLVLVQVGIVCSRLEGFQVLFILHLHSGNVGFILVDVEELLAVGMLRVVLLNRRIAARVFKRYRVVVVVDALVPSIQVKTRNGLCV